MAALWTTVPDAYATHNTSGGTPVEEGAPPEEGGQDDKSDCPTGECGESAGSAGAADGSVSSECTPDPIDLLRGNVLESATDLRLPAMTFPFAQSRSYNSGFVAANGLAEVALMGERWFVGVADIFIKEDATTGDITVYFSKTTKRVFTEDSGSYTSPTDYNATLVKDATFTDSTAFDYDNDGTYSETYTVFDLTEADSGRVYRFLGFDNNIADGSRAKLVEVTSEAFLSAEDYAETNQQAGTTYRYNADGKVEAVLTSGGGVVSYSFVPAPSTAQGKIEKIELKPDGTNVLQVAEYTYYDDVTSPSSDLGSNGDLVMVKVSVRSSAGSAYRDRYTMYRYYTDASSDGKDHQVRAVLEPEAVQRILDSGDVDVETTDEILQAGDTTDVSGNSLSKYFSRSFVYYTADLGTSANVSTSWGTENLSTRYGGANLNEYANAGAGMVKSETINGDCSSCGGSSSSGVTKQYYYMNLNNGPDYDSPVPGIDKVVRIVIEDTVVNLNPGVDSDFTDAGEQLYRTIYGLNLKGKALRKAIVEDADPTSNYDVWCWSTILGTSGNSTDRISEGRMPSAHALVDSDAELAKFLDPTTATNDADTLEDSAGVIYTYEYNGDKRRSGTRLKKGETGTANYVSATDWGDTTAAADTPDDLPVTAYAYPTQTTTRSSGIETTIAYTFWDTADTVIKTRTVTYPAIATGQNGPGVATTTAEFYDWLGRLRWAKDGEGNITYRSYHPDTGGLAYVMRDVETDDLPTDITSGSAGEWLAWDADPDTAGNQTTAPTGFTNAGDDNSQMVMKTYYDDQGRVTKRVNQTPSTVDDDGVTHIVYEPTRTLTFPRWGSSTNKPLLPIRVTEVDDAGVLLKGYSVDPDRTAQTGGVPTGLSAGTDQSHYVALTTYQYDPLTGKSTSSRRYHDIPSSGDGTLSTHYDMAVYQYDEVGRREVTIQTVSGTTASATASVEQVTKVVYDNGFMGRVVETQAGVSSDSHAMKTTVDYDTLPTLRTISKSTYDAGGVGDGHLTKSLSFHGTGANDYTGVNYHRTYRGHLRGVEPLYHNGSAETAIGPYTVQDIRWDGRVTATAVYTSNPTWATVLGDDDYAQTIATGGRRALSTTDYDDLGRPYRARTFRIAASTGAKVGTDPNYEHFLTDTYYDRNSRVVSVAPAHQAATEYAYDGLGRRYQTRLVAKLVGEDSGNYYDTTSKDFDYRAPEPNPVFDSMSGGDDEVYTISHTEFTDAKDVGTTNGSEVGLPTRRYTVDMAPIADNNIEASVGADFGNNDDYVVTYAYTYYDDAGRPVAVINHGTNTDGTGSNGWEYGTEPDYDFDDIPVFTDDGTGGAPDVEGRKALLTTFAYDADTGRRNLVTSATGTADPLTQVATKTFFDDLGRTTYVAENHTNFDPGTLTTIGGGTNDVEDRVTAIAYDGLGNVTSQTAYNGSSADDQVTEYKYADSVSASRATLIKYPDGNTTVNGDNITIAYNVDGSIATRRDQRGVTMTYGYTDRRQIEYMDASASGGLASVGVDDDVQSIGYTHDDLARIEKVTSYDDVSSGSPAIVNEVAYAYNDLGQVTDSYQDHDGAATSADPTVSYTYDLSATGSAYDDGARITSMTYPDSRQLVYGYHSLDNGVFNRMNQIYELKVGSDRLWVGRSSPMGRRGLGILDKLSANGGTDVTQRPWFAVSDDGYDRFGRVAQVRGSGGIVELNYGYDAGSNRVYREDVAAAAQTTAVHVDELYGHDDLSRLDDLDIGDVSTSGTPSMTTTIDQQQWTLDPQGNWSSFASDLDFASGISTLDPHQDRTHNDANEITGLAAAPLAPASSDWVDPVYDAAGNTTKRPDPADQDSDTKAHLVTYDAWNRVVKITDNDVPTTIATYEYDGLGRRIEKVLGSDTYDYYHNESWQVVEVRKNQDTDADPVEQFVYDTHYIDALVMRWYDANQDGTADEQYYLYDASFSVIALLDSQGTPLERYRYTPYGQRIVMDASFASPGGSSGHGQQRGFQGLLHDEESGLIENRMRLLDPLTGRFLQRDPLGYPDGMNVYAAYHVMWGGVDPIGMQTGTVAPPPVQPSPVTPGPLWEPTPTPVPAKTPWWPRVLKVGGIWVTAIFYAPDFGDGNVYPDGYYDEDGNWVVWLYNDELYSPTVPVQTPQPDSPSIEDQLDEMERILEELKELDKRLREDRDARERRRCDSIEKDHDCYLLVDLPVMRPQTPAWEGWHICVYKCKSWTGDTIKIARPANMPCDESGDWFPRLKPDPDTGLPIPDE